MKYYFAGTESRKYLLEEECMNLFLAGEHGVKNGAECLSWKDLNILESFYYASKNPHIPRLIQEFGNFLLDSGAFTFMQEGEQICREEKMKHSRSHRGVLPV